MKPRRKWTNRQVEADAKRFEREKKARRDDKPSNSPGSIKARKVLANLPKKPPGKI